MPSETDLLQRCRDAIGWTEDQVVDPETLIGFFQHFRPDGKRLVGLFDGFPSGDELECRLQRLYAVAGDHQRPEGGKDAYFVVRQPRGMSAELVEHHGLRWLEGIRALAEHTQQTQLLTFFDPLPSIRVLVGTPPKQPRTDLQSFPLLRAMKELVPELTGLSKPSYIATLMREAYYFTTCDPYVRDYLLWPAYNESFGALDCYNPYFELWSHGIKYRVFYDHMIDLYLPRELDTE